MTREETEQLVFKKLHDELGWNLTDSLTTTGEKLVRDTITAIAEINNSDSWIKIESEDDLPKEHIECWFMKKRWRLRMWNVRTSQKYVCWRR